MQKKFHLLIVFPVILLLFAACASSGDPSGDVVQAQSLPQDDQSQAIQQESQPTAVDQAVGGPTPETALPLTDDGQQMVATVGGNPILLVDFETAFERSLIQTESASYDAIASAVINSLIEQKLIALAAQELGIEITEADVETEFQQTRELLPDTEAWQTWLTQNNLTEEHLKQSLYIDLVTRSVIDTVTEPDGVAIDEVHARHVLVSTLEEANAVLARLQAGEDFGTVAAEVSRDITTKDVGGDLGWFTRDSLLTPELAEAAFNLQPNELGGPVVTMLGYHIVQTLEITQRAARPDEEVLVINEQFMAWLANRRAATNIELFLEF